MLDILKCKLGGMIVGVTGYKGYIGSYFIEHTSILDDQSVKEDVLIHLAAHTQNELKAFTDNICLDVEVINYCKNNGVGLIYASGNNVYPLEMDLHETDVIFSKDFYGLSKIAGECLIEKELINQSFVILRIGDVFGKGQKYGNFFKMIATSVKNRSALALYGKGSKLRSYIYIEELTAIFEFLIQKIKQYSGQIFNIAYPDSFSVSEIVAKVALHEGLAIEAKEFLEQPDIRTMNVSKLEATGYPFRFDFDQALDHFMKEVKND